VEDVEEERMKAIRDARRQARSEVMAVLAQSKEPENMMRLYCRASQVVMKESSYQNPHLQHRGRRESMFPDPRLLASHREKIDKLCENLFLMNRPRRAGDAEA